MHILHLMVIQIATQIVMNALILISAINVKMTIIFYLEHKPMKLFAKTIILNMF